MSRNSTSARPQAAVAGAGPRVLRTDIQALRAIAVAAVVVNHLWPSWASGGYVGVDVFFVISGFLITTHLSEEVAATGRVRLTRFYARRVRRLLPTAVLVLVVTAVGVRLLLPAPRWLDNAAQIAASTGYIENWALTLLSVDYSAQNHAASAVQHFWSLSVEEQFYLVWPIAVLGVGLWAGARARAGLAVLAAAAVVLSFLYGLWLTHEAPTAAYFSPLVRAWQFGVGALVAIVCARVRLSRGVAAVLAALGYVGIVVAAVCFDGTTPYPGVHALLPVLATAAVIVAGGGRGAERGPLAPLTDLRPVQWLGEISYSLYLWHWPLLVFVPFLLQREPGPRVLLAIACAALLLAALTRRLVEVPAQRAAIWGRSTRRALTGMAALMLTGLLAAAALAFASALRAGADPGGHSADPCAGPSALLTGSGCDVSAPVADPVVSEHDVYYALAEECGPLGETLAVDDRRTTRECRFGAGAPAAEVWLVGDSHAEQWQGAVFEIARERGWNLTISTFSGCPAAGDVPFVGFRDRWGAADSERCRSWADALDDRLRQRTPDLVITSMAARHELVDDGSGAPSGAQLAAGLRSQWARWAEAGIAVAVIADTPENGGVRGIDCLVLNAAEPARCARERALALPGDPLVEAARGVPEGVRLIDLSGGMCDERLCYAAVGGVPVFSDADHLSRAFAARLAPWLASGMDELLRDRGIDSLRS